MAPAPIGTAHARRDRGSVSVFVIGLVVALFLVAGLVIDGGRALNARMRITDDAENAARTGGNQLDEAALRSGGEPRIDRRAAETAARQYLTDRGYTDITFDRTVGPDEFRVLVDDTVPTTILSAIFIHDFDVSGAATVRAAGGISCEGVETACG
ncbi:TadE/TadG family type IV pilus assembly protein [Sanguibacter suaedae]|uniref:Putative Flp pilus-assembly TadG-like N-terminal domain-containing protein n=1 Tax=Sanguibacter suaedae TaxID=2795737 RepID=A0A934MA34_9MICO|nr:pilus assembly protein TadG-related protein [Sanguibacter suaedae]MBI9115333.1 hypothetical protein [Sanguibacter suaedae]